MGRNARFNWSVPLGRWFGVSVQIHLTLVLGILALLALTVENHLVPGLVTLGVWLVSLILHELLHVVSTIRLGGRVETVVLGPVGGMTTHDVPDEPEPQVLVALAGPAVHCCLVVAATGGLVYHGLADVLVLFKSTIPMELFVAQQPLNELVVKTTLWVNWILFLVNLLPAYPFDAAIAVQSLLWPLAGRRTAGSLTQRLAWGVAAVMLVAGLYLFQFTNAPTHAWAALVLLAAYVAVSAQRPFESIVEYETDLALGEFFVDEVETSEYDTSLRDDSGHMVLVEQHYDQLRERYERQRKAQEDYEDARVDDILARLHHDGLEQLSREDRAFLQRASRRYRNRRDSREV